MEQFAAVAFAHFVALLVPGADFFLIVRTTLAGGWRKASGTCLGIALANGIFIVGAFTGVAFVPQDGALYRLLLVVGGGFLVFLGIVFFRAPTPGFNPDGVASDMSWGKNLGLGFTSGILNPKNVLFYISLASVVSSSPPPVLIGYGAWMFTAVLLWDLFVAFGLGNQRMLTRFARYVTILAKAAGVFLVFFGVIMVIGALLLGFDRTR